MTTSPTHLRPIFGRFLQCSLLGLSVIAGGGGTLRASSDYSTPYAFTLLAGTGSIGVADGPGTGASFDQPFAVALDSTGNLYVADKNNHSIRKVTSDGTVSTFAGLSGSFGTTDGTGSNARFNQPTGLTVGPGGDIYVADSVNNTIRKITPQGAVTTFAGTPGSAGSLDGAVGTGLLRQPYGVAIDSGGNLYVTDFGNNSIRKITSGGTISTFAGIAGVATATDEQGDPDSAGHADGTGAGASFSLPAGIAIDSSGNLYVADNGNNTIRKITSAGVVTTLAGSPGESGSADGTGAAARFNGPIGVAVDGSGNVYVAESGNSVIRKITPAGVVTTLAGQPGSFFVVMGTGAAANFDVPTGIAVDATGDLYVTEKLGEVIAKGVPAPATTTPPPPLPAPVFTTQPLSVSVTGGTVVLNAVASNAASYQWMLNGTAVSGATASTLAVASSATGTYTCVATNATGSATSAPATVALTSTANPGRLINLSARAEVGTGAAVIFGGFAIGPLGSAGTEPVLIRASGPAIAAAPFNVTGTLPDPELTLFNAGGSAVASNSGWAGDPTIAATATAVGAFNWAVPSSHDAALDQSLATGTYTAQVAGQSNDTGDALLEIYDATPAGTYNVSLPRLINLSARVDVGSGANVLLAGFVIGGNSAVTVLVRASGPAIAAAPFNVTGTLSDPQLTLQNSLTGAVYAANSGWAGNPQIANAAASVGAFDWTVSSSHDSALLITLPPGSYTAAAAGSSGDSGVALVEIYEVP